MEKGQALFLTSHGTAETCYENGCLDRSVTESRGIQAQPLTRDDGPEQFAVRGCAAISLGRSTAIPNDDDNALRKMIVEFLETNEMWRHLQARYFDYQFLAKQQHDISLFPTHVTRRTVPPDGMPLVHIDYLTTTELKHGSQDYTFSDLLHEWKSRWSLLEGWKDNFAVDYNLLGVVTVWICLSSDQGYFPLCVAQAVNHSDPAQKQMLRTYRVKGKKHSVGVLYEADRTWYCQTNMTRGDAWLFDTQCSPHVAVDQRPCSSIGTTGDARYGGLRESLEVRVLILQKKTEHNKSR